MCPALPPGWTWLTWTPLCHKLVDWGSDSLNEWMNEWIVSLKGIYQNGDLPFEDSFLVFLALVGLWPMQVNVGNAAHALPQDWRGEYLGVVVFLKEGKKGILTPHSPQLSMRHSFTGAHAAPSSGLWAKLWHIEEVLWMVSRLLNRMGGGTCYTELLARSHGSKIHLGPGLESHYSFLPLSGWVLGGRWGAWKRREEWGEQTQKGGYRGQTHILCSPPRTISYNRGDDKK